MSVCLLIEDRPTVASLYALNLKVYVGLEIVWKKNLADALKVLEIHPNIDVVITRSAIEGQDVAKDLDEAISTSLTPTTLVVLGQPQSELSPDAKIVEAGIDIYALVPLAAKIVGVTAMDMARKIVPDFFPVPFIYFKFITESNCDIYVKLSKKNSEDHYVKVINEGDSYDFEVELNQKYMRVGHDTLYVDAPKRIEFTKHFTQKILDKIYDEKLNVEDRVSVTDTSMQFVANEIMEKGLSPEVLAMSEGGMHSMLKLSNEGAGQKKLQGLLGTLMKKKTSYIYKHSQLISMLGCHALNEIDWGTRDHQEKLTYVAFFHDILLKKDHLAQISSNEELRNADISEQERRLVNSHAMLTLDILTNFPKAQMGVNVLVKQHHGTTNGIGFADNYSSNLSPLAIVFIVCEHYADALLRREGTNFTHEDIVEELGEKFDKAKYRKIIDCFAQVFDKATKSS